MFVQRCLQRLPPPCPTSPLSLPKTTATPCLTSQSSPSQRCQATADSVHIPIRLTIETELVRSSDDEGEDEISPESDDDEVDELESDYGNYDEPSPPVSAPAGGGVITQPSPEENKGLTKINLVEKKAAPAPPAKPPRRKLEKHDRRIDLGLHDHQAHADCPDTLACLPDTHGRPQHTLPVILRCAILGSPRKRLTIREIYATMESKYPYYKSAGETWKVCVFFFLFWNLLHVFIIVSISLIAICSSPSLT